MKKRYQAVSIEKSVKLSDGSYIYYVQFHDKHGKQGVFWGRFTSKNKRGLINRLRFSDVEISKHVENGGKLRLF